MAALTSTLMSILHQPMLDSAVAALAGKNDSAPVFQYEYRHHGGMTVGDIYGLPSWRLVVKVLRELGVHKLIFLDNLIDITEIKLKI